MKKISLVLLGTFMMGAAFAQKQNIQTALDYLKSDEYANAKTAIDQAVENASTITNAKAWLVRGVVYQAISSDPEAMPVSTIILNEKPYQLDIKKASALKASNPNAAKIAKESYAKVMELDKKYDKQELFPLVAGLLYSNYNTAVAAYSKDDSKTAFEYFGNLEELSQLDNGNLFKGIPQMDTMVAQAKLYQAYSAYKMGNNDVTIGILEKTMKNPIVNDENIYIMAADIYREKKETDKYLAVLQTGKKKYPNSKSIANEELNYYITSGNTSEAVSKLESAVAADPNKAELHFNLGVLYSGLSEKETDAKKGAELFEKSAASYKKAIELDGKNADYIYNFGVLEYNKAKKMTDVMNKENDNAKYDVMKKERDVVINRSLPLLEKALSVIETAGISDANKGTYSNVLEGLTQAYTVLNMNDKAGAMMEKAKKVK